MHSAQASLDPQVAPAPVRTVLLADADPERRTALARALERLTNAAVVTLHTGAALQAALKSGASLVVSSAGLDSTSTLNTLTRARESGLTAPFIVYSGLSAGWLRVLVSGGPGTGSTVLSSRVVDLQTLADLADVMLRSARSASAR